MFLIIVLNHGILLDLCLSSKQDKYIILYIWMSFVVLFIWICMLAFIFIIICDLFEWKRFYYVFLLFVYICIDVGDLIIKKGRLGSHSLFYPERPELSAAAYVMVLSLSKIWVRSALILLILLELLTIT